MNQKTGIKEMGIAGRELLNQATRLVFMNRAHFPPDLAPRSKILENTRSAFQECSRLFLKTYLFMAWCLVKHRDNFTFTFMKIEVSLVCSRKSTTGAWIGKSSPHSHSLFH
jgi:hypothetical protein